ncbi:MAG: VWA domain-containing protein [Planctomycetaceae bacterium]|jgi:Ca-activated chloride channel family protein|nr:VWA domain-containing protein [Planctomycetaceae bacterium]
MFDQPVYLLLLWFVPLLALLLGYAYKKRKRTALMVFDAAMANRLMPMLDPGRFFRKALLLVLAFVFGIVAVAVPRFGTYDEEISRSGIDVFILLDVSRSMLAEDVVPNRLERAKSDIQDLVNSVTRDRVGLIAFAGKPMMKVPLTTDLGFFLQVLRSVDTHSAPLGGTAIGDAIRLALRAMPPEAERERAIVLITDGEDQESMPLEAAKDAAERHVRILTIGLGNAAEGGRIPLHAPDGRTTYLMHDGREVWSKMDESALREIARITEGAYVSAGTKTFDLRRIYADSIGKMQGSTYQTERRQNRRHQYQIFLALAVTCLLLYIVAPEHRTITPTRQEGTGVSYKL